MYSGLALFAYYFKQDLKQLQCFMVPEPQSPRFRILSRLTKYQDSLFGSRERDACPQPFIPFLEKCHYIINTEASWSSGCDSCSKLGAHLFILKKGEKNEALEQYLSAKMSSQKLGDFIWIGRSSSCESGFHS